MPTAGSSEAELPVALTIAGSDSGGGAGVQADLLTFAANGVFGTTAITCLTAQNPDGVTAISGVEPAFVLKQAEQVAAFFDLGAVKTGMLYDRKIIAEVAAFLLARSTLPAVIDPVMVSTSGAELLKPDAVEAMRTMLFPCAAVVTPNLDEVTVLTGSRPADVAAMEQAAILLAGGHGVPFLVKGGHLTGGQLVDVLALPDGKITRLTGRRVDGVDTHGSGCTLSAAIAAHLALGLELGEAVAGAHAYVRDAIASALTVGGRKFINHFP